MNDKNKRAVSVLVVEDDDVAAEVVERALKKRNGELETYHVWDGMEALEVLHEKHPDIVLPKPFIVLLDLNMPRMNGIEFLHILRADQKLRKSVVFVLTTSDRESDKSAAYDSQIAGYMLKSEVGEGFSRISSMLDNFLDVVSLPEI